ncbi:MAG: IS1 family transposase [Cyanobacteria bacterium P01_G01_bin.54]
MDLTRLINKPLLQTDPDWRAWFEVGSLYAGALTLIVLANTATPWDSWSHRLLRVMGTFAGTGLATYGLLRNREHVKLAQIYQQREHDRVKATQALNAQQITQILKGMQGLVPETNGFQPQPFDREEILQEATGIAILGNSGSGKTCLANALAQGTNAPILVLDPHGDSYDPHKYPWGDLVVIHDLPTILKCMEYLLDSLDQKDKRPLTIIADEFPKIRAYAQAQNSLVADRFIVQYGSEARKFNKLPIFCSQSGNVKALGLEGRGDFLENFALIRLGKVAVKYAKNHEDRDLYQWLKDIAYPMLIDHDRAHLHPNLGHHQQVVKGAVPTGLLPLDSPPIQHELPGMVVTGVSQRCDTSQVSQDVLEFLKRCHSKPCDELSQAVSQHSDTPLQCPRCPSQDISRNGSYKGQQRFKCKKCKTSFYRNNVS